MKSENEIVIERYKELKAERQLYIPLWKDIQKYVAIAQDICYNFEEETNKSKQKDVYINDATTFISVNQAGDYLAGILWQPNAVEIIPNQYILDQLSSDNELDDFYKNVTETTLAHINSSEAGFQTYLKAHCYDQFSYATSGIGAYLNPDYDRGNADNAIVFKSYGVHNICIDEGANNKVNIIFTTYRWRVNKIVDEFATSKGQLDKEKFNSLPKAIKDAFNKQELNKKFTIVHGVMPNLDYQYSKKGIKGARFKGYWLYENERLIFSEEYYKDLPIAIARSIKVDNQVYGVSSGTLAISSIKMLNFVMGILIDNADKLVNPPFGYVSGSLVNGSVIDTSANAANPINEKSLSGKLSPIFNLLNVGDMSPIAQILLPKGEKDITTVFKIDQLLDFNSTAEKTATEMIQRFTIRAKAIAGLISQQKTELLEPLVHRCIGILQSVGAYGIDVMEEPEKALLFMQNGKGHRIIPEVIAQAMKEGKRWYKIKFNNELEKLANSETYNSLGQFLMLLQSISAIKPEILHAIKPYKLLELCKKITNLSNQNLIVSEKEFKEILEMIAQQEMQKLQVQNQQINAQTAKTMAQAGKEIANAEKQHY